MHLSEPLKTHCRLNGEKLHVYDAMRILVVHYRQTSASQKRFLVPPHENLGALPSRRGRRELTRTSSGQSWERKESRAQLGKTGDLRMYDSKKRGFYYPARKGKFRVNQREQHRKQKTKTTAKQQIQTSHIGEHDTVLHASLVVFVMQTVFCLARSKIPQCDRICSAP